MDQKIKQRVDLISGRQGAIFCTQAIRHGSDPPHHRILAPQKGDYGIHLMLNIASRQIRGYLMGVMGVVVGERLDLLERFRQEAINSLYRVSLKPAYQHQTFPSVPVSEILLDLDMVVCENLLVREKFVNLIRSSSCMRVFMEDYLHDMLSFDGDQLLFDRQAARSLLGGRRSLQLQQEVHRDWLNALSAPILDSDDVDEITEEGEYLLEGDLRLLSLDLDRAQMVKRLAELFDRKFNKQETLTQALIDEFNQIILKLNEMYCIHFPSRSWDADVNAEIAQLEDRRQGGANM